MVKKIIVDSCEHCPLRKYEQFLGDGWKHVCQHASAEGLIIRDISIIDPECLLNDD